MKFKKNLTMTVTSYCILLCAILIPVLTVVLATYNVELFVKKAYIVPLLFVGGLLAIVVTLGIINIIACKFIKHTIFINEDNIEYNGKKAPVSAVKYIRFHFGNVSSGASVIKHCSLVLYNVKNYPMLSIVSPSFISYLKIKEKCKEAKAVFVPKWCKIFLSALYLVAAIVTLGVIFL